MASKRALSLDDSREQLPYVPTEKILATLSNAKKYLPTSAGKYIALNPEINEKDLCNVIYEKFFAADFVLRGRRLCNKTCAAINERLKRCD